jgi:hypothetical protein
MNTEFSFLSGSYLVKNQIKHKCNSQNTIVKKELLKIDSKWIQH